jgi:hypothetical protein
MSFSFKTKQELTEINFDEKSQNTALCYGMLLFAKKFTYNEIICTTENKYISNKITDLLVSLFTPVIENTCGLRTGHSEHQLITTKLINSDDCHRIFTSFGYNEKDFSLRINRANISDDSQLAAFLQGTFLSCGSVTNPEKGYHLEFKVPYRNLANDLLTLLCEIEQCNLVPKAVVRHGYYIVYLKDSEQIADLLTYIGAFNSSMTIMNTKAIKEVRNIATRRVNSELHNIKKTADASARQIKAIKRLMKSDVYLTLSPELKEIAELRLENPELSLRALGELTSDGISRSGVNHRLKKLMSYTDEV